MATSREAGEVYEYEALGIGDDREAFREDSAGRYKWIWEKRLVEDSEEAMKVLRGEGGKPALG